MVWKRVKFAISCKTGWLLTIVDVSDMLQLGEQPCNRLWVDDQLEWREDALPFEKKKHLHI